ncbi:RNA-directed DNA polymerase, eukaryota [Tanacetum coccineum]
MLEVLDEIVKIGIAIGYNMDGCIKDMEAIISSQGDHNETKMEQIDNVSIKALWGNSSFNFAASHSIGNSGSILCVWEPNLFVKDNVTAYDYFLAIIGTWVPTSTKLLIISVYAPQDLSKRKVLWDFIRNMVDRWDGETIIWGDFNEVHSERERFSTLFNPQGANAFNSFISSTGLTDLLLGSYSFTWAHKSVAKMSKLDKFLTSEGLMISFPHLSALCLDKHLSDHRPILMRDMILDYGPTPLRVFYSWFKMEGFEKIVKETWIVWSKESKKSSHVNKSKIKSKLSDIDKTLDQGGHNDDILIQRSSLLKDLHNLDSIEVAEIAQKAKIRWAIEGDENSRYFHGILNSKCSQLAIRGILNDGDWIDDPCMVKKNFLKHFSNRDSKPDSSRIKLDSIFPNQLTSMQYEYLERHVTYDEIKAAMWWLLFVTSSIQILANRLSLVIDDLISEVQLAFVSYRQILDEPFILNELLSWCKHKNIKALIFKVDFKKTFDYVRWDYLDDVLRSFGFGNKWCNWIKGCLESAMGSILVNSSPTSEFHFYKGFKQGDPLSPFLFILIIESLHFSFNRVLNAGLGKGYHTKRQKILASGLKINLQKSKLMGIGIKKKEVDKVARLVVSLGNEVTLKLSGYLSKWKLNTLSIGGHLTLIKSVLTSILLYYMSIFKVPIGVLNKLELIRRNFFNGVDGSVRKTTWIRWNKVLASKKKRSRGFITAIHGVKGALDVTNLPIRRKVGNGEDTEFWEDIWLNDVALKVKFPSIYALKLDKNVNVADKKKALDLLSISIHSKRSGKEDNLRPLQLQTYDIITDSSSLQTRDRTGLVPTHWVKVMPIKVNIFAWRVWLDNLPTRYNYRPKAWRYHPLLVPICIIYAETKPSITSSVWNKSARKVNFDPLIYTS